MRNGTEEVLLRWTAAHPGASQIELARMAGMTNQRVYQAMLRLAADDLVEMQKFGRYKRYWLSGQKPPGIEELEIEDL